MPDERVQRRLAAILSADVVGYSRLMAQDETGTLTALKTRQSRVLEPLIARFYGRTFKLTGDGMLVEFASAVDAVQCAIEVQQAMAVASRDLPKAPPIVLRIGINLGDVIVEKDDLFGDGVNVAARLEGIAEPGSILISGSAFEQVRNKVSASFEDLGVQALKNIVDPVRVFRVAGTPKVPIMAADAARNKPSIAVLPFDNMSGDPEQAYFADGIVEDIIVELSRFRSLFVIARNSSFAFRDESIGIPEIARRLGVKYVVEGSVRRVGNRIRIAAQLIDAASGAHLWAERYDREMGDLFAVQDDVVRTVVATIVGRVELVGAEIAKRKSTEDLAAYDCVLRGLEQLNLEGDFHNTAARDLFQKAVERDPNFAAGHAYLALALYIQWVTSRVPADLDRALASARQAVVLDDSDSRCHRILCVVYTQLRQHDRAELHSDRSIALNPNDALAAIYRAGLLRYLGRAAEGVEWVRSAMRINPYHPNWYWTSLANVLLSAGRYEEALDAYRRMAERPSFYHAYVAACHAELGRMDDARRHVVLALQARPDFSVAAWGARLPYKNDADLQKFLRGMRKAGLPE